MKNRIENLICVLLALSVAGVVAYILYGKRVDEWRQVACSTLKNAVNTEIEERAQVADSLPMYTQGYYRPLAESDFPQVIDITTEQGKRQYTLTWEKFQRNVTQDPDMRVWHSMLFLKHPLSPDTLSRDWNDSLRLAGFSGKGLLRVRTLDVESDARHCVCTGDSLEVIQADSLHQLNMGYVCETEVTGFLSYRWWQVYAVTDWVILLLLLLSGGSLSLLWRKVPAIKERYFTKTIEVEKVVEVEKTVMVADVELFRATCCRLPDGTLFDRARRVLKKGDKQEKLAAQDCMFLWLLVEAKDEGVSMERLKEAIWSSKVESNNALYVNASRLRKSLGEISTLTIENAHGRYRLVNTEEED